MRREITDVNRTKRNPARVWRRGGVSERVNAGSLDRSENTTSRSHAEAGYRLLVAKRRRSDFAREIAASEFGPGRFYGWRQWGEFQDATPAEIYERRWACEEPIFLIGHAPLGDSDGEDAE